MALWNLALVNGINVGLAHGQSPLCRILLMLTTRPDLSCFIRAGYGTVSTGSYFPMTTMHRLTVNT